MAEILAETLEEIGISSDLIVEVMDKIEDMRNDVLGRALSNKDASDMVIVYVTCRDTEEAENIASSLLEKNLIACANIASPHRAMYKWKGVIEENCNEVAIIMKTRSKLFNNIRQAICDMHSYDCPCIVSWPISMGHAPFMDWAFSQTS